MRQTSKALTEKAGADHKQELTKMKKQYEQ